MYSPTLADSFESIGHCEGAHQVLNIQWKDFLTRNFRDFDVQPILGVLMQKPGTLAILDEGCGSSNTLFEVVEALEVGRSADPIVAYGITASTDYLAEAVPEFLREHVLATSEASDAEKVRLELLMGGVAVDLTHGHHRYSPAGNLIQIKKADVHGLAAAFPDQKFDLIYSSNAYPHFADPKLAFEQSCNALASGGLLLVDSLPVQDASPDYIEQLQAENPGYKITTLESDNPFYRSAIVRKSTSADLVQ